MDRNEGSSLKVENKIMKEKVPSEKVSFDNPIIWSDLPDLDVIRVKDVYYMVSTTMHLMPGCVILKSYDLIHWEIASYVYETLEENKAHRLERDEHIYGKGMWAASLRYYEGTFYVCFVANDTGRTYLFQAESIDGPWRKSYIEGFYHDSSLLFDEGKVYIVYGNTNIYLTELKDDLSGPKEKGFHKMIITDMDDVGLGYEGAHFYKIKDKYYIFLIHWLNYGSRRRVEACYVADQVGGPYKGKNILDDDMGYHNAGVAQGGIVDTPDGSWYAMLFQDHGAVGRIPVLVPVSWKDDFPVFGVEGKVPHKIYSKSNLEAYVYAPIVDSDSFEYRAAYRGEIKLKKVWQWNHNPNDALWSVTERKGYLRIKTGKISSHIMTAQNVLTQRTMGPRCENTVCVDGSALKNGDFAGIAAFQGCFGFIALTKEDDQYYLVRCGKEKEGSEVLGKEYARVKVVSPHVKLKVSFNFIDNIDEADFYYENEGTWKKFGGTQKLYFLLDHFVGCRVALFLYATKEIGGIVDFKDFEYKHLVR